MDEITFSNRINTYNNAKYNKILKHQEDYVNRFSLIENFHDFLVCINYDNKAEKWHNGYKFIWARTADLIYSIGINTRHGSQSSAGMSLRTLFELMLYIKYININPEYRLNLYCDYMYIAEYKNIVKENYNALSKKHSSAKLMYDKHIDKYTIEKSVSDSWYKKELALELKRKKSTLFDLAKILKYETDYQQLYKSLNIFVHNQYLESPWTTTENLFNVSPHYDEKIIEAIVKSTITYGNEILSGFLEHNPSKDKEELLFIADKFKNRSRNFKNLDKLYKNNKQII